MELKKKTIYKIITNKTIAIKRMRTKFERLKKIKKDEIEKKSNFINYSK